MLKTIVFKVDPAQPKKQDIGEAARLLREGGLVAFPTETVYGLGADAFNEEAVRGIFRAKGRPTDNPLIVHVAETDQVYGLVTEVPLLARRAMESFWPGPLTIVLPAKSCLSKVVTGGLDTVAIRMPAHPVALELLRAARVPVAAPSANSSGKPSPTSAAHVLEDLQGKVDAVVDGGATQVGVESTVLDMTGDPPVVLRPGGVPQGQLEAVLGRIEVDRALVAEEETPRAPGMKYRHYSPRARMILIKSGDFRASIKRWSQLIKEYKERGHKVALMASQEMLEKLDCSAELCGNLGSKEDMEEVAANLFRVMRELDAEKPDVILAEGFAEEGLGVAVMNRLGKAASQTIIVEE